MNNADNHINYEPTGPANDFPSNLLARVVKADAPITIEQVCPNGDIRFSIALNETGLSRTTLHKYSLTYSSFFINWVGEVFVRKNLRQFVAILEKFSPAEYHQTVNAYQHRHFGFSIDEHDVVHIQFHSSLIQQIMTEDLDSVLLGWLS